jgi:two-component system cell cycle sensor histidine kinase/response regulator CckA
MNLAVNARDAMPKGGCLIITTSMADVTEAHARQRPEARPGRFVCLSVKDTGSGMDAKTLARIFEPFFSTKEVGRGTGLGLATAYGIMKQHQGWIEVATDIGMGTTFQLYFPALNTGAVESEDHNDATPAVRGGSETILLVEDEPVLRDFVGQTLRDYKYRVLEAGSGVEALKVWEKHEGKIDLLLTDMVMPEGMSGSHLARHLRERKPDLKIIFTSGYSPEIIGKNFKESDLEFLQKPYRPPLLAQKVRKCLDPPPRPDKNLLPA